MDVLDHNVGHETLALQSSLHLHQTRLEQRAPMCRTNVFPDDQIDVAGVIFERDESDATRR